VYAAWIADGDVGALFDSLHPDVVTAYGADVCRAFVAREILLLTEYAATGDVTGPTTKSVSTDMHSATIDGIYTAGVSYVFQGQTFDALADFVVGDGVTWLTACR
jgi:hypothetical protein